MPHIIFLFLKKIKKKIRGDLNEKNIRSLARRIPNPLQDSLQLEYNDGEVTLIEHVYDFFCKNDD